MLLKGWMVKTGTTLDELAQTTGLQIPYLSNVQNGKALPKLDAFKAIVDATGLDCYELLEDTIRLHKENGAKG